MVAFDSVKILNAISRANMAVEVSWTRMKLLQLSMYRMLWRRRWSVLIMRRLPRHTFSIVLSTRRSVRRNPIWWIFIPSWPIPVPWMKISSERTQILMVIRPWVQCWNTVQKVRSISLIIMFCRRISQQPISTVISISMTRISICWQRLAVRLTWSSCLRMAFQPAMGIWESLSPLSAMQHWHVSRSRPIRTRCMADRAFRTLIMRWQTAWRRRMPRNIIHGWQPACGWRQVLMMDRQLLSLPVRNPRLQRNCALPIWMPTAKLCWHWNLRKFQRKIWRRHMILLLLKRWRRQRSKPIRQWRPWSIIWILWIPVPVPRCRSALLIMAQIHPRKPEWWSGICWQLQRMALAAERPQSSRFRFLRLRKVWISIRVIRTMTCSSWL